MAILIEDDACPGVPETSLIRRVAASVTGFVLAELWIYILVAAASGLRLANRLADRTSRADAPLSVRRDAGSAR